MPIGVIIDSSCVVLGGIIGTLLGKHMKSELKEKMNIVFGCCAMGIGVFTIVLIQNLPAVILAVLLGTAIGVIIHLGRGIENAGTVMQKFICRFVTPPDNGMSEEQFRSEMVTMIVLFCASGTGIYGSLVAGISGDNSIILAKAILDFFTAVIVACTLGMVISVIAIPQVIIFLGLFYLARFIYPLTTPEMINDFKAVGGFIMLATGFRMNKLKNFPVADMLPAMVIIFPLSALWGNYIGPLLAG